MAPARAPAHAFGPIDARERALCEDASTPDWLYLGAGALLAAGGVAADVPLRTAPEGVRMLGPAALGAGWGFFLGSIYPSLPKCAPDWVTAHPLEGTSRATWPFAVSMALAAGMSAPILLAMEQGFDSPHEWAVAERVNRLVVAGVSAAVGSLVPYVLSPRPWAASKELERLRLGASASGATLTYELRF